MTNSPIVSRRSMLGVIAAAPFAAAIEPGLLFPRPAGATFVLVHGAWHGGWCWKKLVPLLRAGGAEVYTPTLTGMGERAHLLASSIGLDTHVRDIISVLEYEDLTNVVLVGHSYGGMLLASVVEAASERISHLVYLDAFLPEDGKALSDYAAPPPTREDGWRIPPPAPPGTSPARFFGVTNPDDVAWAEERLGDQPLKTFTDPVRFSATNRRAHRRTYIRCTEAPWLMEAAERAKAQGYRYHALFTAGHNAMITQPTELADLLLEATLVS